MLSAFVNEKERQTKEETRKKREREVTATRSARCAATRGDKLARLARVARAVRWLLLAVYAISARYLFRQSIHDHASVLEVLSRCSHLEIGPCLFVSGSLWQFVWSPEEHKMWDFLGRDFRYYFRFLGGVVRQSIHEHTSDLVVCRRFMHFFYVQTDLGSEVDFARSSLDIISSSPVYHWLRQVSGLCSSSCCIVGFPHGGVVCFQDDITDCEQVLMSATRQQPVSLAVNAN